MKRLIIGMIVLATSGAMADGGIAWIGDIGPGDPNSWDTGTTVYIGLSSNGAMIITSGGAVSSSYSYIGFQSDSTGEVTVDGSGSTWTNKYKLTVGYSGNGTLNITNGGAVNNTSGYISDRTGSTGAVNVGGTGSAWTNSSSLTVGYYGSGVMNITNGGEVSNTYGYVGSGSSSTGEVTVDGIGSTWANSNSLNIGDFSSGVLNITDGGLVSIAGILTIDYYGDGDDFINMSTGGMLALYGDAEDSLTSFMGLIWGADAIRYWDDSLSDWTGIPGATYGRDYTLSYLTEGDLAGYTVLTVPEPATLSLLSLDGLALLRRKMTAKMR